MRSMTESTMAVTRAKTTETHKLARSVKLWSFAMMASGIIGVFCGVTGLMINVLFLFAIAENEGLMRLLSIWLLVLAFPMLWLTSHCLDRVDSLDRAIRLDRCGRTGLKTNHRDDAPLGRN